MAWTGRLTPIAPGERSWHSLAHVRGSIDVRRQRKPMGPERGTSEDTVIEDFHRIKRLPPYVFAEVNALKAAARAGGADIIDLGMVLETLIVIRGSEQATTKIQVLVLQCLALVRKV